MFIIGAIIYDCITNSNQIVKLVTQPIRIIYS